MSPCWCTSGQKPNHEVRWSASRPHTWLWQDTDLGNKWDSSLSEGLTITAALHHFSCEDWAEGSPPNKIMILSTTQEWQFWMSLRDPARSLAWTQSISSGETWTYQTINILPQTWCFHTAKSSWHPQQWTICLTAKSQTKSLRHKQSQKCHRDLFLTSGVLQKHLQKQVFIISNSPQITFLH